MKKPSVSVIIGVYNKAAFLETCIESVLNQTFQDFEVIIVDDCSTDGSGRVIEKYVDRVKAITLERNSGLPAVPRNIGLRRAEGEFIAFLDADDFWEPSKLEKQIPYFTQLPSNVGLCHTYSNLRDQAGTFLGVRHKGSLPVTGDCFEPILRHCFISISTVMMRRQVIEDMGLFDEDPFFRGSEDYELFLRVASKYQIGLLDEVLSSYRVVETSISRTDNWRGTPEHIPIHTMMLRRPDIYRDRIEKSYLRRILAEQCSENSRYWRDQGFYGRALWFVWHGFRHRSIDRALWIDGVKAAVKAVKKIICKTMSLPSKARR